MNIVPRLLAVIALGFGLAKIFAPATGDLPHWLLTAIAWSEIIAATVLWFRPHWWASAWMFVLSLGGGVYALAHQRRLCGCLGRLMDLTWREHAFLASGVAGLAAWATWCILSHRRGATEGCAYE